MMAYWYLVPLSLVLAGGLVWLARKSLWERSSHALSASAGVYSAMLILLASVVSSVGCLFGLFTVNVPEAQIYVVAQLDIRRVAYCFESGTYFRIELNPGVMLPLQEPFKGHFYRWHDEKLIQCRLEATLEMSPAFVCGMVNEAALDGRKFIEQKSQLFTRTTLVVDKFMRNLERQSSVELQQRSAELKASLARTLETALGPVEIDDFDIRSVDGAAEILRLTIRQKR